MKLNMEFEDSDLEEMITDYFERNGFEVLDVASIVEKFTNIYPEGIVIQVRAAPTVASVPSFSVVYGHDATIVPSATTETVVAVTLDKDTATTLEPVVAEAPARLSFNDLMDPTGDSGVPHREQLLAERELQHVLKQSKELEDTK